MSIGIRAVSGYVPEQVVSNSRIAHWTAADEEWITARTGVIERRYAADDTATSDLAVRAARPLLHDEEARDSVGLLITATATPDQPQPATSCFVQERLCLPAIPAFDVSAVCAGFLYGLVVAQAMLRTGLAGPSALVIGADKFSGIMNRADRRTVSLFGDGAGAALLAPVPDGYGIHGSALLADGKGAGYVRVPAGGSRLPLTPAVLADGKHRFHMDGPAVRDWAHQYVPKVVHEAASQAGWGIDDIDRAIFHQGNARLVHSLGEAIGIPASKLPLTAPLWGNTAAASIPLTLAEEDRRRPFRRGERLLLAAVGGGMTAAAVTLTWY